MPNEIRGNPLPRRWAIEIDGTEVSASSLSLDHPQIGRVVYGPSEYGYDTWRFTERFGGVVVAPFVVLDSVLAVGLVRQHRANQGGWVWNCPRGFIDEHEDDATAASRELVEETGIRAPIFGLNGEPANPNSAFFATLGARTGVRFFATEISATDVRASNTDRWEYVRERERVREGEHIRDFQFFPWQQSAMISDMFTNAVVARLLSWLWSNGRSHDWMQH